MSPGRGGSALGDVVLTGGAGLIGSHVVDQLVELQHAGLCGRILVLDNFTRGRPENLRQAIDSGDVRLVQADVRDTAALESLLRGADVVFHLAAIRITHCAEDPRLALDVLGCGTFNVLEAARAGGVRKVVASSSASVYGLADLFPTPETHHPYNNRTIYGALKSFNEGLLRSFHEMYGLAYVALRYFNVYGPRMDVHGAYTEVLIRWMNRIAAGEPPVIFGDGSQTMDFVHVRDIARANVLAARSSLCDDVFNVASGTETSLCELAAALAAAMGSDLRPVHGPERAVNAVPRRLADVTPARERLGFSAEVALEEGLADLVRWWRDVADPELKAHR